MIGVATFLSGVTGVCLALLGLGCASPGGQVESWVRSQGGLDVGTGRRQQRVERTGIGYGDGCLRGRVSIQVLASDDVCAYGWPDGRLFITRALVDLLTDDDELAAAVAHELGHLLSDGHVRGAVALRGAHEDSDAECRADAIGAELLRARGLPPQAMSHMLEKVRDAAPHLTPEGRDLLTRRIRLLDARFPPRPGVPPSP